MKDILTILLFCSFVYESLKYAFGVCLLSFMFVSCVLPVGIK